MKSGAGSLVLGIVLLIAVAIDVRWLKNRLKVLSRVYVSPAYFKTSALPFDRRGLRLALRAQRQAAEDVELIGLGEIDAAEDPILDVDDHLYFGSRQGRHHPLFRPRP